MFVNCCCVLVKFAVLMQSLFTIKKKHFHTIVSKTDI